MTGRSTRALQFAALIVVAAWLAFAGGKHESGIPSETLFPSGSNVLIITLDTLRPDALGFVGGENRTPVIDALAAESARFDQAITSVPLTLPAHSSLFSGLYPTRHDVHDNGQVVPATVPLLAETFRSKGYSTAAFVSGFVLRREFGLDRGFDVYDDTMTFGVSGQLERSAAQTVAAAKAWLQQREEGPWLLWVHLYDAHSPYNPPAEFMGHGTRGAYEGEVAYIDAQLAGLLQAADKAGGRKRLTVLTSDHGEAFGEHGEVEHGLFVYDSTMLVPLVISFPDVITAAAFPQHPRLIDIVPTILDGMGWASTLPLDGISLLPTLTGDPRPLPSAYMESEFAWIAYGWAPLHALRSHDEKFIDAPQPELYALDRDPGEATNRYSVDPAAANALIAELDRQRLVQPLASSLATADPTVIGKLQSLGYVGAGISAGPAPPGRPDPKGLIQLQLDLQNAEQRFRSGDWVDSRRGFEAVLAMDPENHFALLRLGLVAIHQGDLPVAIESLRKAVAVAPQQAEAHFGLADALARAGRYPESIEQWLETVRLQPRRVAAWANLGSTLARTKQYVKAADALREALRLQPEDAALIGNLGEVELANQNYPEAIRQLQAAADREGPGTRRASRIGLLLAEHGDAAEASTWLRRATVEDPHYAQGQVALAVLLVADRQPETARQLVQKLCSRDAEIAPLLKQRAELAAFIGACVRRQ